MAATGAGVAAVVALAVLLTGGGSNVGTLVGLGAEPTPEPTSTTLAAPGSPTGTIVMDDVAPGLAAPAAVASALPALPADAAEPAPTRLGSVLAPLLAAQGLGSSLSVDVVDATTGTSLLTRDADRPRVPASTVKLWTGAAVLDALGPQATVATRAVLSGTDRLTLVAGGDALLGAGASDPAAVDGHAGLQDLADQVAAAVGPSGRVSLAVDDSLFSGPLTSPGWGSGDVRAGFVAPITAIMVDAGRVAKGHYARRAPDPSLTAGQRFADALEAAGVVVEGGVSRSSAPAGAREVGRVESAPMGDLVEYMLTESDNTVAEVLGRLVAVKDSGPGTFDGASSAVRDRVAALDVPSAGATLQGTSGLGRGTLVPADSLTRLLVLAASADRPDLRPLLSGLPIARLTGTLADRFEKKSQADMGGVVRAKTGSLTGVSALAGTVVDADGRLIAFAVLADRTGATDPARQALDAVVTAIARCGCR